MPDAQNTLMLSPMTDEDFATWLAGNKRDYAADKMKANRLTQEEANEIAERDIKMLLPDGRESKDAHLYTVIDEQHGKVGYLWFSERGAANNRKAYIFDIVIGEAHRGKGYGKGTMKLVEQEVKKLGLSEIGLHVFGFNAPAIALYKSLGYEVTDLMMAKQI